MKIVVTGGAGFIGSAVIRHLLTNTDHVVINVDKLSYASNLDALASVVNNPRYHFEQIDICDAATIQQLFTRYQPDAVIHLAAESHVDRSIAGPAPFIQTNIIGTYILLETARHYWESGQTGFRFLHVSTDEVYGDLQHGDALFTEQNPYAPSSPYSASKAASDHLVRAWYRTYGLPVLITNCSNNYGPFQYPEKLIPLMILNALAGRALPVYGNGCQVRDWLHVEDHARALCLVLETGTTGETYNIGGRNQKTNIEVVETICELLAELAPGRSGRANYKDLITFVSDRPGHDQRYAIDAGKIERELGWSPMETFETGLRKTVEWYLEYRRTQADAYLQTVEEPLLEQRQIIY